MSSGLLSANAQVTLPPVNLGASSIMDGVAGLRVLAQEILSTYNAPHFMDNKGGQANKTFIRLKGYKETMVKSRPKGTRMSLSINQIL